MNSLRIRLNSFAEFFSSYSLGLSCSPEPFTFVSLLPLSLSLEATCLFYHFYAFLSTPFFAFCFFYTLFPFSYLFLSILLWSFVLLIQKVTTERRSAVTLDCLLYLDKKINSQNRSSVSCWRRHPDLNWGSRCCRPMPYHLAIAPYWSGLRGSNSLPPPWQGGALPDELHPRFSSAVSGRCGASDRNRTNDTGIFSPLLYRLSYRGKCGDPERARTVDL